MAYTPAYASWHNWPTTDTPITAAALQGIEDWIGDIANAGNGGDNFNAYVSTTGQVVDIRVGTSAAPNSTTDPVLKVSRTVQVDEASVTGDGADELCAILGQSLGTTNCQTQPIGVMGFAKTTSTSGYPGNDACGLYGVGRIVTGGTGTGIGAFVLGSRDSDSGTVAALEVKCNNLGGAETYSPGGFSQCTGIWLSASGDEKSGVGLALADNPQQFDVGIGFTAGSIATTSISDDSSSTTSIEINGTHTDGIDLSGATFSALGIRMGANAINFIERSDAGAPSANSGTMYVRDSGGKSQLVIRFASGAVQVIATEP